MIDTSSINTKAAIRLPVDAFLGRRAASGTLAQEHRAILLCSSLLKTVFFLHSCSAQGILRLCSCVTSGDYCSKRMSKAGNTPLPSSAGAGDQRLRARVLTVFCRYRTLRGPQSMPPHRDFLGRRRLVSRGSREESCIIHDQRLR